MQHCLFMCGGISTCQSDSSSGTVTWTSLLQECNSAIAMHWCWPIGSQLCTDGQHAQWGKNRGFSRSSLDPFPSTRVGSRDKTSGTVLRKSKFEGELMTCTLTMQAISIQYIEVLVVMISLSNLQMIQVLLSPCTKGKKKLTWHKSSKSDVPIQAYLLNYTTVK